MKENFTKSSLFFFSLGAFFLAGALNSQAACECTNNPNSPFSGAWCSASLCTDGCHCSCVPNCACASSTLVGSTCSDGCQGTCKGTKTSNPTPAPINGSNCGIAANSNYACSATETSGALCANGAKCYPNTGYPPTPCPTNIAISGNLAHWYCGTDQNCYAKKLDSCATPTPTPTPTNCIPSCSCAYNTPVGSTCSDGCQGKCEGKKIASTGCMINCGCAANTQVGSTCDNGCGGLCQGTATFGSNGACYSSPNNPTFSSYGYYSLDWWNKDYSQYYQPGTKLLKEVCEGDDKNSYRCRVDSSGAVSWMVSGQWIFNQRMCDLNSGSKCVASCLNPISFRAFFVPGVSRVETRFMTTDEGMFVGYTARYNDIPTQSPSSSFPACYSSGNCNNISMKNIKSGQEFLGYGLIDGAGVNISKNNAGWLYYHGTEVKSGAAGIEFTMNINAKTYNDWLLHSGSNPDGSINWERDVESVITYVASDPNIPATGPDCAQKTCKDVSCNSQNGSTNPWIKGTKTEGCATVSASANPIAVTVPGSSYLTWTSQGAKSMEAECLTGPITIKRGGWFLSDAECKASGLVKECTDKGYELKFKESQSGKETCALYPTNISNGLPGTPFSVEIQVGKSTPTPTPTPTPDPTRKTTKNNNQYICQPDNAGCAAKTCHDVYCNDGCNVIKGTNSCLMFSE